MKKIIIILLLISIISLLFLPSCSALENLLSVLKGEKTNEHLKEPIYVLRGEKDDEYNGKILLDIDDISEMLGLKLQILQYEENEIVENKIEEGVNEDEVNATYIANSDHVKLIFCRGYCSIFIYETVEDAKEAYIGNLTMVTLQTFSDINYRINNIVFIARNYFNYKYNTIWKQEYKDIVDRYLQIFGIEDEICEIENISSFEVISNYNETKLLKYFENNGYKTDYIKCGNYISLPFNSLDYIKDGYIIRNETDKTYLFIGHYLKSDEELQFYDKISDKYMNVIWKIDYYLSILSNNYNDDEYHNSYNLYDNDTTIIFSESKEWIDLVKDILN